MGLAVVAAIAVGALVLLQGVHALLVRLGARRPLLIELANRAHRPMQLALVLLTLRIGLRIVLPAEHWRYPLLHLLTLACIGALAWLVASLLFVLEGAAINRYRVDTADNRRSRKAQTQIRIVRRVTLAGVVVLAIAVMLLTFPAVRAAGTSIVASAAVIAAITAFAAQTMLGNLVAGVQIAFSGALKLGDVVVVEHEWGRVEEITLTSVVLHVWDDRRLILPCSYFTGRPFENWTLTGAALIGSVEIDLDWAVPVEDLRAELHRILPEAELWDHRIGLLQVTDAVAGWVRVRALVSAVDSPTLFDLRCYVRERLVDWLRREYPDRVPRLHLGPALIQEPGAATGFTGDGRGSPASSPAPHRPADRY